MKRVITSRNDEWDVFHGRKYMVSGGSDFYYTDDPRDAIKHWFMMSEKHPMDIGIRTKNKSDAFKIVDAGDSEYLTNLWRKYGSPYKLEYIIQECKDKAADNCRGFLEGYLGDVVHPFCEG